MPGRITTFVRVAAPFLFKLYPGFTGIYLINLSEIDCSFEHEEFEEILQIEIEVVYEKDFDN